MSSPDPAPEARRRVVSGVRATGRMHLGNYFGAARAFVELARRRDVDAYFFVADLHTLTTLRDPDALRALLPALVLDYLAAGVDPERVTVFAQSSVPATSELAWLLSSATYVGELERVPAFKERERKRDGAEPANAALLNYPLLMAADILGPRAHLVAVGEDQYAHLELVRDVARRFNRRFFATGESAGGSEGFFPEPQPAVAEPVRIPGLDGAGKMGKSEGNTLSVFDSAAARWEKLAPAVTDPARRTRSDPGTPERCGIYAMHRAASKPDRVAEVAVGCRAAAIGCVDCKKLLNDSLESALVPIQVRRRELESRADLVRDVLAEGARRAAPLVRETRDVVQDKVGIVRY